MSKQLKISDLKRVVNIDEITKLASILKDEKSSENKILNAIERLNLKTPSREVLMKTKLGFILKDLGKNEKLNKEIRDKALAVRRKWKEFHKNLLLAQKLDVKCDKPTSEKRQNAKIQLLKSVYSNENSYNKDIIDLEFIIFQYCDNLINYKYLNIIKNCSILLKQDIELAKSYLNGCVSATDVLTQAIQFRVKSSSSD
jgi:hypothetical protein